MQNKAIVLFASLISSSSYTMQVDFFRISYEKKSDITPGTPASVTPLFKADFSWKNNITLQYQNNKYLIDKGEINYNFTRGLGIIDLYPIDRRIPKLEADISSGQFQNFAQELSSEILNPSTRRIKTEDRVCGINGRCYKAVESLIYDKFPGSKISLSWTDWAKLYWKPIISGLGLVSAAGLGYAYYKYYHAK
ncbi:MAG TPA: hypothetical protein VGW78_07325 [Candidatus Babeliales bacterium]|jgi:hypothetical protein|nr:hypothetical protein [Candidatus Babeliales bacterium]